MSFYPEIERIGNELKENEEKLKSCSRHEFEDEKTSNTCIVLKSVCKKCGGWTRKENVKWYEKGLEHGRGKNEKES